MPPTPDELRPRAKPYLDPISPAAPAGKSAKMEPLYEDVDREVAKLTAPAGGKVDWQAVVDKGTELLTKTTKDLRLAAFVSYGLYATQGLDGLVTGTTAVAELMDAFWPALYPEQARMRGRVGALQWLVDRLGEALPARKVGPSDAPLVDALAVSTRRLADVARAKYGGECPALGPMLDAVARLKATVQEQAKPAPAPAPSAPPPPAASAAPPPAARAPSAPAAPASPPAPAAPAPLADPAKAAEFLQKVGTSLVEAAAALRKASSADPTPYRVLRAGLWLHLAKAPGAGGKSQVPPLQEAFRAQLDKMAANAKWPELVDEAESALPRFRFALDLHRFTAVALEGLGESHAEARKEVVAGLRALLQRMPEALDLHAADGSPLAAADTKAWILSEVLPKAGAGQPAAAPASPTIVFSAPQEASDAAWVAEARKLLGAGKKDDALAFAHKSVQAASGGRARFLARLELAKLCLAAKNASLARTVFEALDEECLRRGLDEWDPALATACLEGLFAVMRPKDMPPAELASRARRLALLNPLSALRAGG